MSSGKVESRIVIINKGKKERVLLEKQLDEEDGTSYCWGWGIENRCMQKSDPIEKWKMDDCGILYFTEKCNKNITFYHIYDYLLQSFHHCKV